MTTLSCQKELRPEVMNLLGMPFHAVNFDRTVELLLNLVRTRQGAYAVTANVDHLVRFHRCPELRDVYFQADLILADGMPLVWASRLLGTPLPQRVAGSDLFPALCRHAADEELSVFLLGGARGSARRAAALLKRRHQRLAIGGVYCPTYCFADDPDEQRHALRLIQNARPDILFLGLGSPKQENWIVRNRFACGARLSIGVGVSFSFYCGDIVRAPLWMQKAGLEWLHRMVQEPRRLARRYLIDDRLFLSLFARAWVARLMGRPVGAFQPRQ